MDKENLNGIPEEENEVPQEQVNQEPETEEEAAENEDITEEVCEEEAEDKNLCPVCGENETAEGSEYCVDCETRMLKRRIPFLGWVSGLAALGFSFFAFLIAFAVMIPSGYVVLGDSYAKKDNWHMAYEAYSQAGEQSTQFNSYINQLSGTEYQIITTGEGVNKRLVNAVANYYSPIDAYYFAQKVLGAESLEKPFMEEYANMYNDNYNAYMQMGETISKALEGETETSDILAELEAFRGVEGINSVFVDYYKFAVAYELGEPNEVQLELIRNLEASAEKSGKDYGWIYYLPLAQALYDNGDSNGAIEYLDKIIASNKSSYDAYLLKMKAQLNSGDAEGAAATVEEFKEFNGEGELTYFSDILEIQYLRCIGKYDEAKAFCVEAAAAHESVPETNGMINLIYGMESKLLSTSEFSRQSALVSVIKGNYAEAFNSMMDAYSMESQFAYYMQYSATLNDPKFYGTLYLTAKLLSESEQMTEESKADVDYVLSMFEAGTMPENVEKIISGEKSAEDVLTKGAFDLA